MVSYVLSQICLGLGLCILGASYYVKNYKLVTLFNIIASVFMGVGYIFLHAYTAIALNFLGAISYSFFYSFKTKNKSNPLYFIIILWVATIVNGVFTYSGWVSLLPTIASLIFYFSVWQKNTLVYRSIGVITTIFYIIYNVIYLSFIGAIMQFILFILSFIGLIIHIIEINKENKKTINT